MEKIAQNGLMSSFFGHMMVFEAKLGFFQFPEISEWYDFKVTGGFSLTHVIGVPIQDSTSGITLFQKRPDKAVMIQSTD